MTIVNIDGSSSTETLRTLDRLLLGSHTEVAMTLLFNNGATLLHEVSNDLVSLFYTSLIALLALTAN